MRLRPILLSALLLAAAAPSFAGPASEALGKCLSDNTNGRERKQLAKWIWMAMSVHPEIKGFATLPPDARTTSDAAMGQLFTRLLADNCAAEARAAIAAEGGEGMRSSFAVLGQLAMGELMADTDVKKSFEGFLRYVDKERMDKALKPR